MSSILPYLSEIDAPTAAEVVTWPGLTLLEFGTDGCGHCRAAQAAIREWLDQQPNCAHRKIEDGPGRALGRHFRVKRWPTLILLRDGHEIARAERPTQGADLLALRSAAQPHHVVDSPQRPMP